MKMKSLLIIIITLLAVSISQATTYRWLGGLYGGTGGGDWTAANNWYDGASLSTVVPGASDTAQLDGLFGGNTLPTMPIVDSDVGSLTMLMFGMNEGGTATLTIQNNGQINAGTLMRIGHLDNSTGIVNMTSGYLETASAQIGYQEDGYPSTGGDGIINMSGSCTQRFGALGFGQDQSTSYGGTGVIHMRDNAVLIVNGDMVTSGSAAHWIDTGAIDTAGIATKYIAPVYNSGNNWTEFTVVPEPGTIGLLCLLGLAFLRKK